MATTTTDEPVEEFAATLRGTVLQPDDDGYEEARTVWNAMIDEHPALIVQCAGTADVMRAVEFAREAGYPISVKSGGHNIAGRAVADDALTIDLSAMDSVRVDPVTKTARVEPGVVLNEFDHETQAFGLATPVGYNSTTGVAGLTLGGGFGWLSRKYGLAIDNLRSADVVTATGDLVHASESENPHLFWGLRGGGGNFGIVTSFEFELHDVGPTVLSGPIVHPFKDAAAVLMEYRKFTANASRDTVVWCVIRHAPPMPFIPESRHGEKVVILATFYAGDMDEGREALQPIRDIGDPIVDAVGPHPYSGWQQAFDSLGAAGKRNYWKAQNFEEFTDEMIKTFIEYGDTIPSMDTEIAIPHLGGAVNEIPVDGTAYPHRDAEYMMSIHAQWTDEAQDDECIQWTRDLHEAMKPHATGGVYSNFVPEEIGDQEAAYRENYDRLVVVKNEWDPENVFRLNHNVEPSR